MVYLSDIQNLISEWTDRLEVISYPQSYRDALNECIYDLDTLVTKAIEDELDAYYSHKQLVHEDAA